MFRWTCLAIVALIVAVGAVELATDLTPLQQVQRALGMRSPEQEHKTVIRLGVASWHMEEFEWKEPIRRYEQDHPDVKIELSVIPEDSFNNILLSWAMGSTNYDIITTWSDAEIMPFMQYRWNSRNPAERGLLVNVKDYLTTEQMDRFLPAMFVGCTRRNPDTNEEMIFELPWMGEATTLNYNKEVLRRNGVTQAPATWDQIEEACAKLKANGEKVSGLSMNFAQTGYFCQNTYIPMLAAYKEGRGVTDSKGRLDVESPEAVKVFETLKRWKQSGYISPNCMIDITVENDLRMRLAAMAPHWQSRGFWALNELGPDVIGIAPTPGADKAGALVCTYGGIFPKCSPRIKQAIDFFYETCCTDKYGFQSIVAKGKRDPLTGKIKGGKFPVLRDMANLEGLSPDIAAIMGTLDKGYFFPDPTNFTPVADILVVEFQKYLDGATPTAQAALARVKRRMEQEVYNR